MFESNLLYEPNYKLIPEIREYICRLLNAVKDNEIQSVVDYNEYNPKDPKPSLFAKVLIQAQETDANVGAIKDNYLTVANGEIQSTNYHTLITLEIDKSNSYNSGFEQEDYYCDCRQFSVATNIRLRTQRELGKKAYVEQLVKYLKDNLTRNNYEFESILESDQNWSGNEYKSKLFLNWDSNNQSSDLVIDPETNWYFYQFQIVFEIITNHLNINPNYGKSITPNI